MIRASLIYVASSIVTGLIPFLLLPILTRFLSPEMYGKVAMFNICIVAFGSIIGLSVHGAANRRYFDNDISKIDLARFNFNCVIILILSSIITLLVLFFSENLLSDFLNIPISWLYLCLVSVFSKFLINLRLGQWQIRKNAKYYGLFQIVTSLVNVIFSILFVVVLLMEDKGRVYAVVITSVIAGIFSCISLIRTRLIFFRLDYNDIKYALSFGVPLIPHVVGAFLLVSIDRLIVTKELGIHAVGIYMVAVNIGNGFNMLFNAINKAYSPLMYEILKNNRDGEKKNVIKITYVYFLFLSLFGGFSFLIAPKILEFVVGPDFHDASRIIPFIVMGQIFRGMYYVVSVYIFFTKKTKFLSAITICSGLLNVGLIFYLIPHFGLIGAAASFMISMLFQFSITWFVSAFLVSMPWRLWNKS